MSELQNLANNQEEQKRKIQMIKDLEQATLKENKLVSIQREVQVEDQNQLVTFEVQQDGKRYKDLQSNTDLESRIIVSSLNLKRSENDIFKLIGDTDFNKRIDLTNELIFKLFGKKEPNDIRDIILVRSMIIIQQMAQKIMDIQENIEITNKFNAKVKNALVANLTENLQLTDYLTTFSQKNTCMEILNLKSQIGQITNKLDKKENIKEEIDKAIENINRQVSSNFDIAQSNMSLNIDKAIQEKLKNANSMEIDSDISNIASSLEQLKNQISKNTNDIKILKEQVNNNVRVNTNEHKTIEAKMDTYMRNNNDRVEKVENLAAQNFEQICGIINNDEITIKNRNTPKIDNIKSSLEAKITQLKNEIAKSIAEINRKINEKYNENKNMLDDNINRIKETINEDKEANKKINKNIEEDVKERNKKMKKELTDDMEKKINEIKDRIDTMENNWDKKSTDSKKEKIKINKENIEKVNKVVKDLVEAQKKLTNKSEEQENKWNTLKEDKNKNYSNINKEIINIKTEVGKLKETIVEKEEIENLKETINKDKQDTTVLINNKFEEIKNMIETKEKKKGKKEKKESTSDSEAKYQIGKLIEENKLILENQKMNEEIKIIREKLEEYTQNTGKAIHDRLFKQISENKSEIEKINATLAICLIFKEEVKEKKEQDKYVFEKKAPKEWKDLNLKERLDNLVREKKSFMDSYKERLKEMETIKNKIKAAEANIANLDNTTRNIKVQLNLNKDIKKKEKNISSSKINEIRENFINTNNEIMNEINNKEEEIETNPIAIQQNKIEELISLLDNIKQICQMDLIDQNQIINLISKMTETHVDESKMDNKISEALSLLRIDLDKNTNNTNHTRNNDTNRIEILGKEKRNDLPEQYKELLEELKKGKVLDSIIKIQNTINTYKNQTIEQVNEITRKTNENTQKIGLNTEEINKNKEKLEMFGSKIRELKIQLTNKNNIYIKKNISNKSSVLEKSLNANSVNDSNIKEENNSFKIETNSQANDEEKLNFEPLLNNNINNIEDDKSEININNNINYTKTELNDNVVTNYKLSLKNQNMPNNLWMKLSIAQKKLFWNKRNMFIQQQKEKIFKDFKDESIIKTKLDILKYYEDKIPILNKENKIIKYETKKEYNDRRDQNKTNFINQGFYRKRKKFNNSKPKFINNRSSIRYKENNGRNNNFRNNNIRYNNNRDNIQINNNSNNPRNVNRVKSTNNSNFRSNNNNNFRNNNYNNNITSNNNRRNNVGRSYQKKILRNSDRQMNNKVRNNNNINNNNRQTYKKKQIYQKPKIATKRRNLKRNNNNRVNRRFNNNQN